MIIEFLMPMQNMNGIVHVFLFFAISIAIVIRRCAKTLVFLLALLLLLYVGNNAHAELIN